MDTEIRYVELVGEDLRDAARRELERGRERTRAASRRMRLVRPVLAWGTGALMLAGLIGVVMTGGTGSDDAGEAIGGETGASATGATAGGFANEERGPALGPMPAATPAPGSQAGPVEEPPITTRVIRTAQLEVVIPHDSFDDRFADAADVASDHGGYVQDTTGRERSGQLTMRVPAAEFGDALAELRRLGDVKVQRIQGEDVTAQYVDLQARLRIAESRRDVLLRLMDEANSIGQTIRVQNALDETQLRIEEIQGQLNLLDDRTSLATIRVELREVGVEPVAEVEAASIPNAFERAVAGFVDVIATIIVGLGYLLPLLLIGGVVWLVVVVRRRRVA